MKITTYRGGKPFETEALTQHPREDREYWCNFVLKEFFVSTKCGIKDIEYYFLPESHEELIRVYYDNEKNCYKDCWITGDSKAAIVEDMYRQKVVY